MFGKKNINEELSDGIKIKNVATKLILLLIDE
ncbi:Uncharacterised protein [[Clostridium] sordellii]|nr:Uncharacterised protein [[Clostridium] sordellii] [Paeniclostridium sordellii]CEP92746.1 Uncharacterised protein [[Clostridium] sordellii] [Paeniclostridium sordellii]